MALCALHTALSFDLYTLAEGGTVAVLIGRESDNAIRLDSPTVPYLLSRHHATLVLQPDGGAILTDLDSTNGTYVSRNGSSFRRLQPRRTGGSDDDGERRVASSSWSLTANDVVGFGGPDTIVAEGGGHVPNPFMFRYRPRIVYEPPPMSPDHEMGDQQQEDDLDADVDQRDGAAQGREVIEIDLSPAPACFASTSGRGDTLHAAAGAAPCGGAHAADAPPGGGRRPQQQDSKGGVHAAHLTCADIVTKNLMCPICHEWLVASHVLPCGHMFCGLCLAKWLAVAQRQSCPSCRKPVAGLPVRCFQVDNTISDLLGASAEVLSPCTKQDRRRKQRHWEDIQVSVLQDWNSCLQPKRQQRSSRSLAPVPHILVGALVEPRGPPAGGAARVLQAARAGSAGGGGGMP